MPWIITWGWGKAAVSGPPIAGEGADDNKQGLVTIWTMERLQACGRARSWMKMEI